MRKIIHLDMDCFYAAIEMREAPALIGKPMAVGGGESRGVICTCNYEARKFGVRSAMPGFIARERCPQLIFLPVRFDLYRKEAKAIQAILREYTSQVEPLSLDEAYLDVSASPDYAWHIAKKIRAQIAAERGLTASAGIAPNKMLAKIASEWKKPNGQFAILPEQVKDFMVSLPIQKIWGIGPKSAERLLACGIQTCGDLQRFSLIEMAQKFGKWGEELFHLCRGEDDRIVDPHWIRKSLSNEKTFSDNLVSLAQCEAAIAKLAQETLKDGKTKAGDRQIRKAFVTIKFADFTRTTKECIAPNPTPASYQRLLAEAYQRKALPVRLLGAGVRFLEEEERQLELFSDENL